MTQSSHLTGSLGFLGVLRTLGLVGTRVRSLPPAPSVRGLDQARGGTCSRHGNEGGGRGQEQNEPLIHPAPGGQAVSSLRVGRHTGCLPHAEAATPRPWSELLAPAERGSYQPPLSPWLPTPLECLSRARCGTRHCALARPRRTIRTPPFCRQPRSPDEKAEVGEVYHHAHSHTTLSAAMT